MASKKLCIVCRKYPPEVPDRDSMSKLKKVCGRCHAKRLLGDLERIQAYHKQRDREERTDGE